MENKSALRGRLRAVRAARDAEELASAGAGLARHGVLAWRSARTVAAYAAVRDEPPTRDLLDGLVAQGVRVLLPCVDGPALDWSSYQGWEDLAESPLGLLEPSGGRLGGEALGQADIVAVPALAVDRAGNRLGRGGGYYDRALAEARHDRVVAVVFVDEVLDHLPTEAHDVRMHAVLTPAGLTSLGWA